jgi:hypothetical protein
VQTAVLTNDFYRVGHGGTGYESVEPMEAVARKSLGTTTGRLLLPMRSMLAARGQLNIYIKLPNKFLFSLHPAVNKASLIPPMTFQFHLLFCYTFYISLSLSLIMNVLFGFIPHGCL